MKKALIVILLLVTLCFSGCAYRLAKPESTNLEFWITEQVDSVVLNGYQQKYGMFGGYQYYGSGYIPTCDENDLPVDPEHCVIYTITAYPDFSSKSLAITEIFISDPNVYVYGLTINSNEGTINKVMCNEGYKRDNELMIFTKGKVTIWFGEDSIQIDANVTNIFGIVF